MALIRLQSLREIESLQREMSKIQNDKVQAEYKNGILSLTLPKAEDEKNRVVKVNIG